MLSSASTLTVKDIAHLQTINSGRGGGVYCCKFANKSHVGEEVFTSTKRDILPEVVKEMYCSEVAVKW